MFEGEFNGLCGLPSFVGRIMTIHCAVIIAMRQAITYIDNVIQRAKRKTDMWKSFESYFQWLKSAGLTAAPNRIQNFSRKIEFLGHIVSDKGIQPFAKNVQVLKKIQDP